MLPSRRQQFFQLLLLLLLLLPLLLATLAAVVKGDNQVCCPKKDRELCENPPEAMKNGCFGGTGAGCEGIPLEGILRILPNDIYPLVRKRSDGTADVITTVGSIRHDLCCLQYRHGLFCNINNRPVLSFMFQSSNCACADEWRTAVNDLVAGYVWRVSMPLSAPPPESLKQDADASETRKPWLRVSATSYGSSPMLHGINECPRTRSLWAPDGTKLACPKEDSECKFSCSSRDQKAGLCKGAGLSGLVSGTRYYKDGIKAGNSEFCHSGVFVEISYDLTSRWGICGSPKSGGNAMAKTEEFGLRNFIFVKQ